MKTIKNINAVLIVPFFTVILLGVPVQAHADWSNTGMHPGLAPNLAPPIRVEPQHRVELPQPVEHYTPPVANHTQPDRHDQPVNHDKDKDRHEPTTPGYFRRDTNYYGHAEEIFPYADVDPSFVVPDGFEVVTVNGETFYYNQGVFYQQVGGQLTVIPPVLGAVVDSIPEDYQIVMADGVHYLFTGGVYYQRVDQGFEVVEGPGPDQG